MIAADGHWVSWSASGRSGARLGIGPVFSGEISYPHDFGLGPRWKAWLNQRHLGFFRSEAEARQKIEAEIMKQMRLMQPAWELFRARTISGSPALSQPRRTHSGHKIPAAGNPQRAAHS